MRVRVSHQTVYEYETPARSIIQLLRLTPRSHEGQRIASWRIDIDVDCALMAGEDAFGNITQMFTVQGPLRRLEVHVEGEADTFDTAGVASGAMERFPPELYLRSTSLTEADDAMRAFAETAVKESDSSLGRLHALMELVCERMEYEPKSLRPDASAKEAFALGRGTCSDYTHIFIACARYLAIPARYVSGYFVNDDTATPSESGHAWSEAFVENLGWVGFDPVNGYCPREGHIGVARGLDYLGAAPVRGSHLGGANEKLAVSVIVKQALSQQQT